MQSTVPDRREHTMLFDKARQPKEDLPVRNTFFFLHGGPCFSIVFLLIWVTPQKYDLWDGNRDIPVQLRAEVRWDKCDHLASHLQRTLSLQDCQHIQLYHLFHIWRGTGEGGSYRFNSHIFRLMRKRKKISLDDVCSGKEALRKGTEALNKRNKIMSNTTISVDEGHFELAKSICMANNHIHLQLQII